MKINIFSIVRDHFDTLYDVKTGIISKFDIALFYGFPIILSIFAFSGGIKLKSEVYDISVTFFGIFIALLLNIQVAMFSVFQRKWERSQDKRLADLTSKTLADRRTLLMELNANLSYLILVCCCALVLSLLSYIKSFDDHVIPAVMVFIYAHFLLTLLMVVKRAHALFHKEYRDSPS